MQLLDQVVDAGEDRVERVLVARQQHPAGQRSRAFAVERIESQVDHFAWAAEPGPVGAHRVGNGRADGRGEIPRQGFLQLGRRAEMVQQVGMGTANSSRHRLQGDCLRTGLDQ